MEIFNEELLKKLVLDFNMSYKQTVDSIFTVPFEENPEAFVFYDLEKVDIFLIQLDKKYSALEEYFSLIFQGDGKRHMYKLKQEDYSNFYKYGTDTRGFLIDFINEKYENGPYIGSLSESLITRIEQYNSYELYFNENGHLIYYIGSMLAKKHAENFAEHIDRPAKIYADRAYKYAYTDLDFTDIIRAVNNQDFEYALNESLAAFEHNLFLAATATAGSTLENLLLIILEKNSIKIDENLGTEIGYLTNTLQKEGIINRKMKLRIMNAASLRNLASHANKGRTIREDAKYVFQTIYTLAAEVYLPQVSS